MQRELIEAFDRADEDDEVRAIIMTGAGRAYCAGADLEGGGSTFDWRERGGVATATCLGTEAASSRCASSPPRSP